MDVFLQSSMIEILIPKATDFDIEGIFGSADDNMSSIEKRSLLYFGMQKKDSTKAPSSYSCLGTC